MRFFVLLLLLFSGSCIYGNETVVYRFKNWGLYNVEQDSHIDAPDAWLLEQGSKKVIVAVVDTGIDPNHKNLRNNLWHDPNNPSVYGWNFVTDRPNPLDDHGHGSHVSGIIGAVPDAINDVSGVARNVSIMSLKYFEEYNTGSQNLANGIRALNYAVDHGANIINYSGGGPEFSEQEFFALKRAESKGILVVAAAGNEHEDDDIRGNYYYPSSYHLSNVISVMATDIHNKRVPSSNWGKKYVDVGAPGEQIYSTLPGNRAGYMTGTSQATAFVTGIAVLLLSNNRHLTPSQIKSILIESSDRFPQLKNSSVSGGRVNAYSALKLLKRKTLLKF